MLAIHTILHPTDFSDQSQSALWMACALTRDYGARLVVLHVVAMPTIAYGEGVVPPDPAEFIDEAQQQLNRLEVPLGLVRAERRIERGDTASEIIRVARELPADLIVMGTHGRTGISRLLMGSVAEQVLRTALCSVLTMKMPFVETVLEAQPETAAA